MPQAGEVGGDDITEMARRLCMAHPEAASRTLAKRLLEECGNAITFDAAYNRIRRQFGVSGAKNRRKIKAASARPPRIPGDVREMPASKAEAWGPHELGVTGTVGVLSDIHVP